MSPIPSIYLESVYLKSVYLKSVVILWACFALVSCSDPNEGEPPADSGLPGDASNGGTDADSFQCVALTPADAGESILDHPGTSAILSANVPEQGNVGFWTLVEGDGGTFDNFEDPTTTFHGQAGHAYTLRWIVTNGCELSSDTTTVSFRSDCEATTFEECGDPIIDARDCMTYPTVRIGEQCWMARNLNRGQFVAYDPSDNGLVEKLCYDYRPEHCDAYGGLYRWDEMMDYQTEAGGQGICPEGWIVPTEEDFETLIETIGGNEASYKIRTVGEDYWENNAGATNESGFSARAGGDYWRPTFSDLREAAYFWTSTFSTQLNQKAFFALTSEYVWISHHHDASYSASLRCIRSP